ncbi:hypothetical protein EDEG_02361 [Edhazardia aedis USNM 41457]|uniref:RxLR effector protein n=1 Tax=Edhazardia aedis (strain USNM 41457) TaxID=1003232 RepID=J9DL20_EDHAE|nr:hypothetical protein EDEG_02361 [Edhazardia aedis USNM 41457]|eukprot:EJW03295.1 hypothetical protein EDEG_02361 [Edhazardia aedis USNM 41457]
MIKLANHLNTMLILALFCSVFLCSDDKQSRKTPENTEKSGVLDVFGDQMPSVKKTNIYDAGSLDESSQAEETQVSLSASYSVLQQNPVQKSHKSSKPREFISNVLTRISTIKNGIKNVIEKWFSSNKKTYYLALAQTNADRAMKHQSKFTEKQFNQNSFNILHFGEQNPNFEASSMRI